MRRLDGVRVVDLSLFLPGPYATLILADQGADVLKVEPPGGDPARQMGPMDGGMSFWFRNLNRGKRSTVLDLKTEGGREVLWGLLGQADVLVEGFRPGVMARLGFAPANVLARAPRLVWCSISAFGQTGAMAQHPAHDLGAQALAGFLSVNDGPDGTPVVPGVPAADMAAGLTAAAAILVGLFGARATGRGGMVDCAMFDALLPWSAHLAGPAALHGAPVRSAEQRSLGGAAFYQVYRTADGRHLVLCGREEKFARHLLDALGRPDLIASAMAPAGPLQQPARAFLSATFGTRTRDAWVAWFEGHDVAFAPVLDFAQALATPHVAQRGLLVEAGGGRQFAPAIRWAGEEPAPLRAAPALGQDAASFG